MSERFEMRVTQEWLMQLDAWRRVRSPIPSRSAAVLTLVATGYEAAAEIVGLRAELAAERAKNKGSFW